MTTRRNTHSHSMSAGASSVPFISLPPGFWSGSTGFRHGRCTGSGLLALRPQTRTFLHRHGRASEPVPAERLTPATVPMRRSSSLARASRLPRFFCSPSRASIKGTERVVQWSAAFSLSWLSQAPTWRCSRHIICSARITRARYERGVAMRSMTVVCAGGTVDRIDPESTEISLAAAPCCCTPLLVADCLPSTFPLTRRRFAARRSGLASGLALAVRPAGSTEAPRARVGPEDAFCGAVFAERVERIFGCPCGWRGRPGQCAAFRPGRCDIFTRRSAHSARG